MPVDAAGPAADERILWQDMRGAPALARQFRGLVNYSGLSLPRIRRWIRLTGGMPSPTGKDPAAHMLFVRDAFPDVYERTYKFLNVLDYLNLRLTGRFVATDDSILTSWVTDNRRPGRIRYDERLVRDCGVAADKLPEIVRCTDVLGPLTAGRRRRWGCRRLRRWSPARSTTPPPRSARARSTTSPRTSTSAPRRGWPPRAVQEDRPVHRHRLGALRGARPLAAHRHAVDGRRQPHVPARQRALPPRRAAHRGAACRTCSRPSTAWSSGCRPAATA